MSYLNKLLNKVIISVNLGLDGTYNLKDAINKEEQHSVEACLQLIFDDYSLYIYNPGKLSGTYNQSFNMLEKQKVISIEEDDKEVLITFEKGIKLNIDLIPKSNTGPEIMCLYGPDNLIVVWD